MMLFDKYQTIIYLFIKYLMERHFNACLLWVLHIWQMLCNLIYRKLT